MALKHRQGAHLADEVTREITSLRRWERVILVGIVGLVVTWAVVASVYLFRDNHQLKQNAQDTQQIPGLKRQIDDLQTRLDAATANLQSADSELATIAADLQAGRPLPAIAVYPVYPTSPPTPTSTSSGATTTTRPSSTTSTTRPVPTTTSTTTCRVGVGGRCVVQ